MDKRLANDIIQHFDMKTMQVLEAYVEDRKASIHNLMEVAQDPDIFRKLQGQIIELRTLLKLRDYAVAVKETS